MGVRLADTNAERRRPSTRSTSTRVALGGAQRAGATRGFLSRCLAVLAGPSARELGQDCQIAAGGRAPHLEALARVHRRIAA